MKGLALVVTGGMMVACGHDFADFGSSAEATIQENYESAFVSRFGQPAANQDWGFSDEVAGTRATEAEWTQYAKTAADYLDGLTEAEMKEYTPFTDDDIDAQGFIFGTSTMGTSRAMTRDGESVWVEGEWWYKVPVGFNPTDGQTVEVKGYNDIVYGTLTFHGTNGTAAEANGNKSPYEACLTRKAISFTANFSMDQAYLEMDGPWAPFNWTDNDVAVSLWGTTYDGVNSYKNGMTNLSGMVQAGHTYKVWYTNDDLQFWGMKVYHQGNVTLVNSSTGDNTGGDNTGGDNTGGDNTGGDNQQQTNYSKFYRVASGTTITKNFHITTSVNHGSVIYVEGKLNVGTSCTVNGVTIVVANGGEVIVSGNMNLSTYGNFIVLPGGKMTGTAASTIAVTNGSKCYNAGEINYAGELNVNGSDFYNCGTVNVSSLRNTSGGKITNFGTIVSGGNQDAADTYNCIFINGCYWHYTGNAGIGTLTMLNNSRLDVDGRAQFSGQQTLYDLSMINCQDILCQQTSFAGPTGEDAFAIVKISRDVYIGYGGDITASGNVYFDWGKKDEGLYVNGGWSELDNEWSAYHGIKENMSKFANEAGKTLYIPEGECTGTGFTNNGGNSGDTGSTGNPDDNGNSDDNGNQTGNVPTGGNPTNAVCRIIVEDLTVSETSDFDFNDVVFDVCPNDDGATTTLIIRAVGGELQLWIEGQEVHQAVWGYANTNMMNTGRDGDIDYHMECGRIVIGKYIDSRAAASDISIEVTKMAKNIPLKSDVGKVASKICVGTDYQWCSEMQDIDRKYHKNGVKLFQQYVIGNLGLDWYRQ